MKCIFRDMSAKSLLFLTVSAAACFYGWNTQAQGIFVKNGDKMAKKAEIENAQLVFNYINGLVIKLIDSESK